MGYWKKQGEEKILQWTRNDIQESKGLLSLVLHASTLKTTKIASVFIFMHQEPRAWVGFNLQLGSRQPE